MGSAKGEGGKPEEFCAELRRPGGREFQALKLQRLEGPCEPFDEGPSVRVEAFRDDPEGLQRTHRRLRDADPLRIQRKILFRVL